MLDKSKHNIARVSDAERQGALYNDGSMVQGARKQVDGTLGHVVRLCVIGIDSSFKNQTHNVVQLKEFHLQRGGQGWRREDSWEITFLRRSTATFLFPD